MCEVIIDFRTCRIDAFGVAVDVVVVGSGESDAKLGEAQRFVVAPLLGAHIAEIGNGQTHIVGAVARTVICGMGVVIHQVEGGC